MKLTKNAFNGEFRSYSNKNSAVVINWEMDDFTSHVDANQAYC